MNFVDTNRWLESYTLKICYLNIVHTYLGALKPESPLHQV